MLQTRLSQSGIMGLTKNTIRVSSIIRSQRTILYSSLTYRTCPVTFFFIRPIFFPFKVMHVFQTFRRRFAVTDRYFSYWRFVARKSNCSQHRFKTWVIYFHFLIFRCCAIHPDAFNIEMFTFFPTIIIMPLLRWL